MLSIIIPTLNEEKNLESLLKEIREQAWTNYEIIVSDGNSNDRTIEIAQKYNCRFFVEKNDVGIEDIRKSVPENSSTLKSFSLASS